MDSVEGQKRRAGERAALLVESGMRVGFGTGSTTRFFTEKVGELLGRGSLTGVFAVPTSRATAELVLDLGIPVVDLEGPLDLAVDGADEVAPDLSLIKGGGGALLREKIVAAAADQFVVIAHEGKDVSALGTTFKLPVEIARFGANVTLTRLTEFGEAMLRGEQRPYVTDNGNYIVDIDTGPIGAPAELDVALSVLPGVVATGLFVGMADSVIFGHDDGTSERHRR